MRPGSLVLAAGLLLCSVAPGMAGTQARKPSATAVSAPTTRNLFEAGEEALARGDLDTAEQCFRRVLGRNPRDPGATANLGVVYMRRRDWTKALAYLRRAERLAPKVAGIRLNEGLAYYRQGNYEAAIAPLASVVRDQPDNTQATYLLGLTQFFTGRYGDAVQTLQGIFDRESYDLNYLYVLSIAAHEAKLPAIEERALGRLLQIGNNTPEFHLIMGKAYLNRDEFPKALSELQQAAQADPRLPFVHFSLGTLYLKQQSYERARQEFLEEIALEPDVAYAYERLAEAEALLGEDQQAEKHFKRAVQLDARLPSGYLGLARIYSQRGDWAASLQALEHAGRLTDSANLHYMKGQALRHMGRLDEARSELALSTRMMEQERRQRQRELNPGIAVDPQLANQPQ
jgi:tetratricopeptide (TPR) repeat protein